MVDGTLLAYIAAIQVQEEFMTFNKFEVKFIRPIQAGQARDAASWEKGLMTKRLGVLQVETQVGG